MHIVWTTVVFQDVQSAKIVSATNARIQFYVSFVESHPVPTVRTPTPFNPVAYALNLPCYRNLKPHSQLKERPRRLESQHTILKNSNSLDIIPSNRYVIDLCKHGMMKRNKDFFLTLVSFFLLLLLLFTVYTKIHTYIHDCSALRMLSVVLRTNGRNGSNRIGFIPLSYFRTMESQHTILKNSNSVDIIPSNRYVID